MTGSIVVSSGRWLFALAAMYTVGNLGALILCWYLVGLDLSLAHLIPWLFLPVPSAGLFISIRWKLLSKASRFRNPVAGLLALYLLTWLAVVYVYLMNVYPSVF